LCTCPYAASCERFLTCPLLLSAYFLTSTASAVKPASHDYLPNSRPHVRLSARKGTLRVHGKGATLRELPLHPQLRSELRLWLDERPDWPQALTNPALLLNRRGARLTTRGASDIFRTIATTANLDDKITAHIGRHTFATTLIRGGTDLVVVAELLGHARLDTVRAYTARDQRSCEKACDEDRNRILNGLSPASCWVGLAQCGGRRLAGSRWSCQRAKASMEGRL
jgi:hypothetical protein